MLYDNVYLYNINYPNQSIKLTANASDTTVDDIFQQEWKYERHLVDLYN